MILYVRFFVYHEFFVQIKAELFTKHKKKTILLNISRKQCESIFLHLKNKGQKL